jgi:hypothetical protein
MQLISLRWLLLLVFIGGMFESTTPLVALDPTIAWWSLGALGACALLLTQLARSAGRTLWIWTILAVFIIGYFVQTVFVSRSLHDIMFVLQEFSSEWGWVSPEILIESYRLITLSFIVFCVSCFLWLIVADRSTKTDERRLAGPVSHRNVLTLLAAAGALSLLTTFVRWYLGIGLMGVDADHLPYRLDTVIFRLQSHLLPGIFLLVLWVCEARKRAVLWYLALLLFLVHCLAASFIAASKAGVVWFALPLFLLWVCSGRLTRMRVGLIAAALSGLLLAYPVISAVRYSRIRGASSGQTQNLVDLTIEQLKETDLADTSDRVMRQIILRISGAPGVWFTLRHIRALDRSQPAWRNYSTPLSSFYSANVYGITWAGDFRSPGIVAAFILAAGIPGYLFVWPLFVWTIGLIWRLLGQLRTAPLARAYGAYHLELFVMEGTLQFQDLATAVVVILFCELTYRMYLARRGSSATARPHALQPLALEGGVHAG